MVQPKSLDATPYTANASSAKKAKIPKHTPKYFEVAMNCEPEDGELEADVVVDVLIDIVEDELPIYADV